MAASLGKPKSRLGEDLAHSLMLCRLRDNLAELVDRIPGAEQLIDVAHRPEGDGERFVVAMDIGDDADSQVGQSFSRSVGQSVRRSWRLNKVSWVRPTKEQQVLEVTRKAVHVGIAVMAPFVGVEAGLAGKDGCGERHAILYSQTC